MSSSIGQIETWTIYSSKERRKLINFFIKEVVYMAILFRQIIPGGGCCKLNNEKQSLSVKELKESTVERTYKSYTKLLKLSVARYYR